MSEIYYEEMASPIGPLLLLKYEGKIIRIDFGILADLEVELAIWLDRFVPVDKYTFKHDASQFEQELIQLDSYFTKRTTHFQMDYQLFGTPFQQKVWEKLVEEIPYGQMKSYKDIAIAIGNVKAVRAIGGAVNKNPLSIVVPCHRVVGATGKLVGYNGGLDKKEFLLQLELEKVLQSNFNG
ncbi:methylated-DNA--[protein]-cysteine S-methyltransferase [Virgibacillus soli]|uniref:Methylated-DNA--[protein]-cysteine S-methyltransferase n=1 Tax=Paracerasibacillus soli TaxID=480284 RepID=A0ABU5CPL1_9BACI|nr:methylated-DNA--[protein]-cysteine S-methyltransferase [Virgibacillus soli]MDY0407772.1 methylated-DNA--[protein]-cysteine S-methyltransferase [Virgibacillus soli]